MMKGVYVAKNRDWKPVTEFIAKELPIYREDMLLSGGGAVTE